MQQINELLGCAICAMIATAVIVFICMGWHSPAEIHAGQRAYEMRQQQAIYVPKPTIIEGE